jgi:hypothetical protein
MTEVLAQYLLRRYAHKAYDTYYKNFIVWADMSLTTELFEGVLEHEPHLAQYLLCLCNRAIALGFNEFASSPGDQVDMIKATRTLAAYLQQVLDAKGMVASLR